MEREIAGEFVRELRCESSCQFVSKSFGSSYESLLFFCRDCKTWRERFQVNS